MEQTLFLFIALLSPAVFLLTALFSFKQPGFRPTGVKHLATAATVISIVIAAVYGVLVMHYGVLQVDLTGIESIGLSVRIDVLSTIMFGMIALLSFIIFRFSMNYLDGDSRQGAFIGRLAATVASVQLLVLAGNLIILFAAWVLTSISLHRLLLFYSFRPGAVIAAKKKFILARLADVCLFIAFVCLYHQFQTGNLEAIFTAIKSGYLSTKPTIQLESAAIFLALAAVLKSAQFPTHGWLIEVMETPTPVSALLHAGLLNAGPFIIIRMAYVMNASAYAHFILLAIGGFTAVFASTVYLTQTSVKTALGYSSVAHMGFSLLVCGLGLYPAALLHVVAHSFYKAHAFLSSGSVIDVVRASKTIALKRIGSPFRIILGIVSALIVYGGFAMLWGFNPSDQLSLLAIGAIIVMGMSRIFTTAFDSKQHLALLLPAALLAILVAAAFFILEAGTHQLVRVLLPEPIAPTLGTITLTIIILMVFGLVVFIQILSPTLSSTSFYRKVAIHIRNGFYANALFDRLVGALKTHVPVQTKHTPVTQLNPKQELVEVEF